ncbi:MAG: CocE/NonD family hydrolase [Euryarchaeota archaeon]|nr:CocE/NonD family hydrolase [Euryarchaeota archaeon]
MTRLPAVSIVLFLALGSFAGCLDQENAGAGGAKGATKLGAAGDVTSVFPGTYKFDARYSQVVVEGTLQKLKPVHQFIKSKIDGADIEIGYWLPDVPAGTKVPVIVHASPYHRPAGAVTREAGMKLFLVDNFLPHGYAVAAVAVRGTADSGGCMDLMGQDEVRDLDQAITWLGEQPWSSGAVGMIGVSYDGSTPWSVASTGNKYLKTIVPISGVPDVYHLMYRNGTSESRGPILLNYLYYAYGWDPLPVGPLGTGDPNRSAEKRITGLACPESLQGLAWSVYSGVYGERDPLGWWAERNRKPGVEKNYKGSILSVQGLQDWNVDPNMVIPWADQLEQERGIYVKQMLGQWPHASPDRTNGGKSLPQTRWDWAEILLHWFDRWLKDMETVDLGPKVQVQDNTMRWRNEERFPPVDAEWATYHLGPGNQLVKQPGPAGSALLSPTPLVPCVQPPISVCLSQQFKSLPGYSADFSTPPVEAETLLSGTPRLHVTVVPKGPTSLIGGWMYTVDPSGKETKVGSTQMNLMFADGTEKAKPIVPNMPLLAKMEFQALDAVVPAGHKILVRLWQLPSTDRIASTPPFPVELQWGGSARSTLELPVIARGEADYFKPPFPTDYDPLKPAS